jgi:hypothetical protein
MKRNRIKTPALRYVPDPLSSVIASA